MQSWKMTCGKSLAMKVEHYIKQLSRAEKEKIIAQPALLEMQIVSTL